MVERICVYNKADEFCHRYNRCILLQEFLSFYYIFSRIFIKNLFILSTNNTSGPNLRYLLAQSRSVLFFPSLLNLSLSDFSEQGVFKINLSINIFVMILDSVFYLWIPFIIYNLILFVKPRGP